MNKVLSALQQAIGNDSVVITDGGDFLLSHKLIERLPDWNTFIDDSWIKKAAKIPSQMK